jgi:hypothetical protein
MESKAWCAPARRKCGLPRLRRHRNPRPARDTHRPGRRRGRRYRSRASPECGLATACVTELLARLSREIGDPGTDGIFGGGCDLDHAATFTASPTRFHRNRWAGLILHERRRSVSYSIRRIPPWPIGPRTACIKRVAGSSRETACTIWLPPAQASVIFHAYLT